MLSPAWHNRRPMPPSSPNDGAAVCSVRPESIRVTDAGAEGSLPGRCVQTTYLGEIAHRTIELEGGVRVDVSQLNPDPSVATDTDSAVGVVLPPEDVVVLPA